MEYDQIIIEGYKNGLPIKEIARQANRHPSRIKIRAAKLGLSHPNRNAKIESDALSQENTMSDYNHVLAEECKTAGICPDDVAYWWYKTNRTSLFIRRNDVPTYDEIREDMIAEMKKYAPKYKKRNTKPPGEHLMVIPHADVHIGKWCDPRETNKKYGVDEAVERCKDGTHILVEKAKLHGVNKFVLCIGNDILHVDNNRKTTTSGTVQDTEGSIFTMFEAAKKLYIGMIEELAKHADVQLVFVPSNHDWVSGYMLADTIGSWFNKHPNVHIGESLVATHRKYLVYGRNLLMFTHGDGAKEKDLHNLMSHEAVEAWSKTLFRYVYAGHIHHKVRKVKGTNDTQLEKDGIGVTFLTNPGVDNARNVHIEYLRSQSEADGWHDRNGYVSKPACEAFLHHPTEGQVARFTHWF